MASDPPARAPAVAHQRVVRFSLQIADDQRFVTAEYDATTGKTVGWEPIEQSAFARWHAEALATEERRRDAPLAKPGTYELVGPKVNGNPERCGEHMLIEHATALPYNVVLTDFDEVRAIVLALAEKDGCEGIVWHHPDGRMAKLKARDFPKPTADVEQEPIP